MKKIKLKDGTQAFTGRALYCPMCGGWLVKAPGIFGKITVVDGEVECGRCGTKITFGNQERLDAMTEEAEKVIAEKEAEGEKDNGEKEEKA